MLYADDSRVVSQSPEQLRKIMGVIVVVCAAFGLTVSEATTEIMCLRKKGMPESTATFSVGAAGQVYNQTNAFVYCYEPLERFICSSHKHWNHGKIMEDNSAIIPLDIRNGVILTRRA